MEEPHAPSRCRTPRYRYTRPRHVSWSRHERPSRHRRRCRRRRRSRHERSLRPTCLPLPPHRSLDQWSCCTAIRSHGRQDTSSNRPWPTSPSQWSPAPSAGPRSATGTTRWPTTQPRCNPVWWSSSSSATTTRPACAMPQVRRSSAQHSSSATPPTPNRRSPPSGRSTHRSCSRARRSPGPRPPRSISTTHRSTPCTRTWVAGSRVCATWMPAPPSSTTGRGPTACRVSRSSRVRTRASNRSPSAISCGRRTDCTSARRAPPPSAG